MEKLINILELGFAIIGASIFTLAIVLYVKLSNIEDMLCGKDKCEDKNE